jgi:hypothetical protein
MQCQNFWSLWLLNTPCQTHPPPQVHPQTQTKSSSTGGSRFTHRLVESRRPGKKVSQHTLLNSLQQIKPRTVGAGHVALDEVQRAGQKFWRGIRTGWHVPAQGNFVNPVSSVFHNIRFHNAPKRGMA